LGGQSKFSRYVLGAQQIHRPIWKPYGLATSPGFLYVCDTEPANVGIIDLAKPRIRYLRPEGPAAMRLPINVAVDPNGLRYVTDIQRGQVLIYDEAGQLKGEIGVQGEMRPCGIALAGDRLYVTDLTNHCVWIYNKNTREELLTLPREGSGEEAVLRSPTNVAVDREGQVYVSDTGGFFVQVYDAQGNHVRSLGDMGLRPGNFALPKGIGVDRGGILYVVDAAVGLVQMFSPEGQVLMYFGEPNSAAPVYLPAGLTIDYDNVKYFSDLVAPGFRLEYLIWVANQAGPRKIAVYGFINKK
jgi:DNA-binding beta-propeller fold protein YncE